MLPQTTSIWQRNSQPNASGKPGAVHLRLNGSLRDELLNGEIFYSLAEAKVLIEAWRRHYNTVRPHSSLATDHRPPAPETATPPLPPSGSASLHLPAAMAPEITMH